MRVYVAGPYSGGDVAANVAAAIDIATKLLRLGHSPYVPHLTHFWHMLNPEPYDTWIQLDLVWLKQCEAIVRLPGASPGADIEEAEALKCGIKVLHGFMEFLDWTRGKRVYDQLLDD